MMTECLLEFRQNLSSSVLVWLKLRRTFLEVLFSIAVLFFFRLIKLYASHSHLLARNNQFQSISSYFSFRIKSRFVLRHEFFLDKTNRSHVAALGCIKNLKT
jgi:hypothetical protein